jgi:hypothetical protein
VKLTQAGIAQVTGTTVELNGTSNEGLVEIVNLTTAINALVATYNVHTHTSLIPGEGYVTSGVPNSLQTILDKDDYENTKVVH